MDCDVAAAFDHVSHHAVPQGGQRWPQEVLYSLPTVDSQRVEEAAYALRKRTSCADDHLVIEMLRELEDDTWRTLAKCFQFRLLNHWTEYEDMLEKKERQTDD